ncbi:uncharacterized protein [Leptinotarsa decemlineata]|uniref:uncharacterized protein n=1 Tax=Leptinotarsa decemlineata TaxID=7539 RepID=UPI003D307059
MKVAEERKADIVLVQEHNLSMVRIRDATNDTATLCRNRKIGIMKHTSGAGYSEMNFGKWALFNCYISQNITSQQFKAYIDEVMQKADRNTNFIIAGDLNAKSTFWISEYTESRGEYIAEWMNSLNLAVQNTENTPTFVRGRQASYIDVTLSSEGMASKVFDWQVSVNESMILHRYIFYIIDVEKHSTKTDWHPVHYIDKRVITNALEILEEGIEDVDQLVTAMRSAQAVAMEHETPEGGRLQSCWWNDQISALWQECYRFKRVLTRARSRQREQGVIMELERRYKETRRTLRRAINEGQKEQWNLLCE